MDSGIKRRFLLVMNDKGVSQHELADVLGIQQSSVSKVFRKEQISKIDYYMALQKLTNCNLLWVLFGKGEMYLEPRNTYYLNDLAVSVVEEDQPKYQTQLEELSKRNELLEKKLEEVFTMVRKNLGG